MFSDAIIEAIQGLSERHLKTGCKQPSGSLKATKSTFNQTIQIKIK